MHGQKNIKLIRKSSVRNGQNELRRVCKYQSVNVYETIGFGCKNHTIHINTLCG